MCIRDRHKAAHQSAEAAEKVATHITEAKSAGAEMTDDLIKTMHDKHGVTKAQAGLEHAAANHSGVSGLISDVVEEPKGKIGQAMGKIKGAGTGRAKVAMAAVAGAAVVGGIANKMFGQPTPSTRVDPSQLQAMSQQQAAMSY